MRSLPYAFFRLFVWQIIVTDLQIISSESAHILDNDDAHSTFIHQCHQALEVGAFKVCAAVTIVHEKLCVRKSVVISIFLEYCFLIDNTVAVTLEFVITG